MTVRTTFGIQPRKAVMNRYLTLVGVCLVAGLIAQAAQPQTRPAPGPTPKEQSTTQPSTQPWIGLTAKDFVQAENPKAAALVSAVDADSPADKVGLQPDDVVTIWAGKKITSKSDLDSAVQHSIVGRSYEVGVLRKTGDKYRFSESRIMVATMPPATQPTTRPFVFTSTKEVMALIPAKYQSNDPKLVSAAKLELWNDLIRKDTIGKPGRFTNILGTLTPGDTPSGRSAASGIGKKEIICESYDRPLKFTLSASFDDGGRAEFIDLQNNQLVTVQGEISHINLGVYNHYEASYYNTHDGQLIPGFVLSISLKHAHVVFPLPKK